MAELKFSWAQDIVGFTPSGYMGKEYQGLFASYDNAIPRLLLCDVGHKRAYLPILSKRLSENYCEAYSAYGYGGLLGDITMSDTDVNSLKTFMSAEGVSALFIRHSPFLNNQKQWPSNIVELNRQTYATSLQFNDSFEDYLKAIPQKLRWSVNYSRRAGLCVTFYSSTEFPKEHLRSFHELYSELMRQKKAFDYYLFSEDFFLEHAKLLGDNLEFAEIIDPKTGELMAGAFFLLDETGWIHYHLSAATQEAMKLQVMELLMTSALYRYGRSGFKALHLGGGHSLDEGDGLSRFKVKFSDQKLSFCCTKLICDELTYEVERARLPLRNPNLFLISDARGG
ncbi:GNAT family N-acetyltransferase [Polynucleobacter paneuropaeus]|nr:GNAT family N-acetyltransferase [Polynucleobacter paneuropaeus]